jgi:hypothetical protein
MTYLCLPKTLARVGCAAPPNAVAGHADYPVIHYYFYSCLCYVLLGSQPI